MTSLFNFLAIDKQQMDLSIQNPFLATSNSIISNLYKLNLIRKGIKAVLSPILLSLVKIKFFSSQNKPKILDLTEQKLKLFYEKDVLQLEELLNIDLSRWKIR
jgi:hypothetical protein